MVTPAMKLDATERMVLRTELGRVCQGCEKPDSDAPAPPPAPVVAPAPAPAPTPVPAVAPAVAPAPAEKKPRKTYVKKAKKTD